MSPDELHRLLSQHSESLNLSFYLTPKNLSGQKEAFFASSTVNPQFEYEPVDTAKIKNILAELEAVTFISTDLKEKVLSLKLEEAILECKLLLALETDAYTQASLNLFKGSFSPEYQVLAEQDAQYDRPFAALETLTGAQTVPKIKEYLAREYHQTDWHVEVSNQGDFYVRVKASQKVILVNDQINWDFTDLDTMLAHEIDGHVLRYLNSQKQELQFLRKSLPFYIKTEEGLSSFLGDYCSPNGKLTLKHHALKYLAGIKATTSSFRETYDFLIGHGFTESLAFQRTFRLKRGITDTTRPGCFTKEALYYEGLIEVKKYLDTGGSPEKLFSGKFALTDLTYLPEPTTVILPPRLSRYLEKI